MNQNLAIQIEGKPLALPEDFSIDYEDVNPYFNDNESFSYPVEVPIEGNRRALGNLDDVNSEERAIDLDYKQARIIACGIPFRSGRVLIDADYEIDTSFAFSMQAATTTLKELVSDLSCRDIPLKDKIQIGEMIGNVQFSAEYYWDLIRVGRVGKKNNKFPLKGKTEWVSHQFDVQALGFSYPGICQEGAAHVAIQDEGKPVETENFINTADEYPHAPYCNARVCYTHYEMNEDGETSGDVISSKELYDPYYVLEANRQQSGLNFYVLYFLDCLFKHLDINYDNSALTAVGDLKRLAFFTTHCKYDAERKYPQNNYDLSSLEAINNWLTSRNTKGKLYFDESETKKNIDNFRINGVDHRIGDVFARILGKDITLSEMYFQCKNIHGYFKASIMNMYANSQNFPESSVTTILDSLWASFGIRFMMDYEKNTCSAVLIRDLYRNQDEPIAFRGRVISIHPVSENVKGVRMKYDTESTKKEQMEQIKTGQKDYNTSYDYTDYSKVDDTKTYPEIVKKQSSSDTTTYIDKTTGNAYRIKVNSDAEMVTELKPSIFEVGAFKGVDMGDCSVTAEETDSIIELSSDFEPVEFNDVNGKNQKAYQMDGASTGTDEDGNTVDIEPSNTESTKTVLAAFADEDMWHENCEMTINNVVGCDHADFLVSEILNTDEAYDPEATDDGNSPLQSMDWGNAIAIMRGGGADATVQTYDHDYDGMGTSKWRTISGEYAMTSDSIDNFGAEYDYNGVLDGVGTEERMSLKIRAFKEIDGQVLCNDDVRDTDGNITTKVRSRGLYDTFMAEHAHFLLNRKKYIIRVECEMSEIVKIPDNWHRRFTIGEKTGWINKVSSKISVANGLEEVEIEMYSL